MLPIIALEGSPKELKNQKQAGGTENRQRQVVIKLSNGYQFRKGTN
jgi:hypothetical protein